MINVCSFVPSGESPMILALSPLSRMNMEARAKRPRLPTRIESLSEPNIKDHR